jgi:hypothetical protein
MKPRLHTLAVVTTFVLSATGLTLAGAQQVVFFTHGAAEGGQVKTAEGAVTLQEGTPFAAVPDSALTVTVAAGDNDLFVYEFNAECQLFGGPSDSMTILARVNGSQNNLEPSVPVMFCNNDDGATANAKTWATRLSGGTGGATYTFTVHWALGDAGANNNLIGQLRARTVRITRYN